MLLKDLEVEDLKEMDCFTILGVTPQATIPEIKKAYHKVVPYFHPDVNPDDKDAGEKMQLVNAALDKIKTEEKKNRYIRYYYQADLLKTKKVIEKYKQKEAEERQRRKQEEQRQQEPQEEETTSHQNADLSSVQVPRESEEENKEDSFSGTTASSTEGLSYQPMDEDSTTYQTEEHRNTPSEEEQEERRFQDFLNSRGEAYKAMYNSYYQDLVDVVVDDGEYRDLTGRQIKQIVRKLAVEYTDNAMANQNYQQRSNRR